MTTRGARRSSRRRRARLFKAKPVAPATSQDKIAAAENAVKVANQLALEGAELAADENRVHQSLVDYYARLAVDADGRRSYSEDLFNQLPNLD